PGPGRLRQRPARPVLLGQGGSGEADGVTCNPRRNDGPLRHRAGIRDHDLARALLHLLLAGPRAAGGGRRAGGERERRRRRKRVEHTLSGRVKSRSVNSSSLKILLLALAAACGSSSSQPAGQTTGTGGTTGG